jgi:hypothetical protein
VSRRKGKTEGMWNAAASCSRSKAIKEPIDKGDKMNRISRLLLLLLFLSSCAAESAVYRDPDTGAEVWCLRGTGEPADIEGYKKCQQSLESKGYRKLY